MCFHWLLYVTLCWFYIWFVRYYSFILNLLKLILDGNLLHPRQRAISFTFFYYRLLKIFLQVFGVCTVTARSLWSVRIRLTATLRPCPRPWPWCVGHAAHALPSPPLRHALYSRRTTVSCSCRDRRLLGFFTSQGHNVAQDRSSVYNCSSI